MVVFTVRWLEGDEVKGKSYMSKKDACDKVISVRKAGFVPSITSYSRNGLVSVPLPSAAK